MTSSPIIPRLLSLAVLLGPVLADQVILSDGSKLSGQVTELADDGKVVLRSDLAFEPFQVRADHIRRVTFAGAESLADTRDCMVTLANGDQFPGDLSGLDATHLKLQTDFAGELSVPRGAVSSVQLGMRPRKTIYRGPTNDEGWNFRSGWRYDSGRFVADSGGTVSRNFNAPGSYALSFRLTWKNSPNLQVFFSSESLETTGKSHRYYIQFNASGMELKRQDASGNGSFLSMASIPHSPDEFETSAADIELLVDRKLGVVHVLVQGEKTGEYRDPASSGPPSGQGVIFRSLIGGDDVQTISRIQVREWDPSATRHRSEERGDITKDVLITRSSDRGTGQVLSLVAGPEGGQIRYKGPHHPEPVDLPLEDISTLFFAGEDEETDIEQKAAGVKLSLRGRGSLSVGGCIFHNDKIDAKHPLLGDLVIDRDSVASLQRDSPGRRGANHEEEEEGDD